MPSRRVSAPVLRFSGKVYACQIFLAAAEKFSAAAAEHFHDFSKKHP